MRVQVLLFGAEREAVGSDRLTVDLPGAQATCLQLRSRLLEGFPQLKAHLAASRFAVNGEFAAPDRPIGEADEVALIGLVSGG